MKLSAVVNPDRAIPIHYNDYDQFQSSLSDFQDKVKAAGLQDRIIAFTI